MPTFSWPVTLGLLVAVGAIGYSYLWPVSEPSSEVGTLSLVAEDFRWAENLVFDGEGGLFVSDFIGGSVDKLQRNPSTKAVTKTRWVSYMDHVLGLAVKKNNNKETASDQDAIQEEEEGPEGFVVYRKDGVDRIASFSTTNASADMRNRFELPTMGNGLALHARSGMLYTACEGDFIPYAGQVLAMNTNDESGKADTVQNFDDNFYAGNGAFVAQKQNLLFVSEVAGGFVRVYDISSSSSRSSLTQGKLLYRYSSPGMWTLDDFCVVELPSGALIFVGADFSMRKVVAFLACPKERRDGRARHRHSYSPPSHLVLASGFGGNPTSVRLGEGAGWQAEKPNEELNLFITEGGPILDTLIGKGLSPIRNRRLYELTVPIAALEGLTQGI